MLVMKNIWELEIIPNEELGGKLRVGFVNWTELCVEAIREVFCWATKWSPTLPAIVRSGIASNPLAACPASL